MNVDTAIQHTLFKSTSSEISDLVWCANQQKHETISRYQKTYNWTLEQCEEFLHNIIEAYELLIGG
jgi:hypothetical protein